ncbi:MAG: DUF1592 domain-containing protein, partial [Verrucomicrobia bacterium]|nr:DUF1592 domain-containing protein [Verrucomicrobiota bacterium]
PGAPLPDFRTRRFGVTFGRLNARRSILGGVLAAIALLVVVAMFWAWRNSGEDRVRYALPRLDLARAEVGLQSKVLPVLREYCWDCHGDGASKGDVALDAFTNTPALLANRRLWERVLHVIASGEMPPAKKPQPDAAARQQLVQWLDSTLFPVDPDRPDPGRVTLRRLNRAEYNNTIRDLVGVEFQPAEDFPEDDVGYGFDNIGDVLSLPPLLLEKYLSAAERVMDAAIVEGPRPPPVRQIAASQLRGGADNGPMRGLASNGELTVEIQAPAAGSYSVEVRAHGDQAGPDPARMTLRMNGRDVESFEVKARSREPGTYAATVPIPAAGAHTLAVAFVNDFYQVKTVERKRPGKRPVQEEVTEDRNLWIHDLTLTGPTDVALPLPVFHQRFMDRGPADSDAESARKFVGAFVRRAWRRPVSTAELDRLMTLYGQARETGATHASAARQTLTAVLVSPHFLFRGELHPDPDNPGVIRRVGEHALASRLSYFLWSSMPDDTLLDLADRGRLRAELEPQVRRMVRDPKARALTDHFAGQWLGLRTLGFLEPDREKFPAFTEDLRRSLRGETERFFEHIVTGDRPVMDFLLADYTFLNGTLSRHYGVPGAEGEAFVRVSLSGTPRQGLLTQGSILALTSNPTRTSPVKRGKWVLENLLASPPPPPPPGVPELEGGDRLRGSLRLRMEQHRENPLCASCHERMDPIGFAFEHFDGIGAWRDTDGKDPVEPSGRLNTGESFTDHRELNALLASARRPDFLRCLTEKLLTYALGRGLEYYDRPAVQRIVQDLETGNGRFSDLILGVVNSAPFQLRRGEGDPNAPRGEG